MTRVTYIDWVVLPCDFQEPSLLFDGICIVEAASGNGKDDEVIVKAIAGAVSM